MTNQQDAKSSRPTPTQWAKVIDNTRCIGCHACTTACKSENEVPISVNRTYVKYVDVGWFPDVSRHFQVTRCNQCATSPCATACPTSAMFRRSDGIVDFDKSVCIGCKACIAACPYDAIFINPSDHSAEKCNFCAHRIDSGLEPACVVVCPTEAIIVGDLNDPGSEVARLVAREKVQVRRPDKDTEPRLYYREGHQSTLDPLAAQRPDGGLFMWSQQSAARDHVTSRVRPGPRVPTILSYDVPHRSPWDWRVSLYTWTKGIAAGVYLVAIMLLLTGAIGRDDALWLWGTPLAAGTFLALTGAVLISDLEHPERFYLILTRPQWRSWLARGAYIIAAFAAVLAAHFIMSTIGWTTPQLVVAGVGVPAGILTAIYTAFLFRQAEGRDLWQSPLLPPHMLLQAVVAGAGAIAIAAPFLSDDATTAVAWILGVAALAHLMVIAAESVMPDRTEHARVAAAEMTRGRYAPYFWANVGLVALGILASAFTPIWMGVVPAAGVLVLIGLIAFEHAYVQAGQSVPLA